MARGPRPAESTFGVGERFAAHTRCRCFGVGGEAHCVGGSCRVNARGFGLTSCRRDEGFRGFFSGNVRELRNVIFQSLVAKRAGDELLLSDLPLHIVRGSPSEHPTQNPAIDREAISRLLDAGTLNLRRLQADLERAALELALTRAGGSPSRAARLLGEVGRGTSRDPGGTVRAMMRRHDLG